MSTNTRQTTESQTTASRTPADAPADPGSADASSADAAPKTTDDAASWVARCQRQFDASDGNRLRNLADAENGAMP